jgi:hypothetical protein
MREEGLRGSSWQPTERDSSVNVEGAVTGLGEGRTLSAAVREENAESMGEESVGDGDEYGTRTLSAGRGAASGPEPAVRGRTDSAGETDRANEGLRGAVSSGWIDDCREDERGGRGDVIEGERGGTWRNERVSRFVRPSFVIGNDPVVLLSSAESNLGLGGPRKLDAALPGVPGLRGVKSVGDRGGRLTPRLRAAGTGGAFLSATKTLSRRLPGRALRSGAEAARERRLRRLGVSLAGAADGGGR